MSDAVLRLPTQTLAFSPPYDIDVSVLGSQMQRRHSVGVGGLRLQHGCTHVAAEQELHHLKEHTLSLEMEVKLPLSGEDRNRAMCYIVLCMCSSRGELFLTAQPQWVVNI